MLCELAGGVRPEPFELAAAITCDRHFGMRLHPRAVILPKGLIDGERIDGREDQDRRCNSG
jgi:hypothetical protein